MSNHCPINESTFLEQSFWVFSRISALVEDMGGSQTEEHDKRAI